MLISFDFRADTKSILQENFDTILNQQLGEQAAELEAVAGAMHEATAVLVSQLAPLTSKQEYLLKCSFNLNSRDTTEIDCASMVLELSIYPKQG